MKSKCVIFYFLLSILSLQLNQIFAQNLSVGLYHTQYVCKDGRAMSWGADCDGRCGRPGPTFYPDYVNLSIGMKKVSAGGYHSLYLDSLGRVWSSGNNQYGQTGTGTNGSIPHLIQGLDSIIDISAGRWHSLFLRYDGTVYACGRNDSWQLGDGSNINKSAPVLIPNLDSIVQLSAGYDYSLFVRANGDVYGSGSNGGGKIGLGNQPTLANVPLKVNALSNIIYASAGEDHSLFVDLDGQAFFSGSNYDGKAGIGSSVDYYYYPEHIYTVDNIIQVECENDLSLFLRADSTVFICGRYANAFVTGGINYNNLSIATQIPSLSGVTEIGIGEDHLVVEIGDSVLFSMGDNHDGILGDGSTYASHSPVQVTNLCGAPLIFPPDTAQIEENSNNEIIIYPNPAADFINIEINGNHTIKSVGLLDVEGKQINLVMMSNRFDIRELSSGIYFVEVLFESGKKETFKLIKE